MNTPTMQSSRQGQQTPSPMDLVGNSFILEPNNRAEFVHGLQRRIELEESRRRQQQQQDHGAANSNSLGVGSQTQPATQHIQSVLQQQLRQQREEAEEELQQQQSHRPCLSCMMRALQASGMINPCWSAAFAELEEAFAIKRVADVMTGDSSGAAAATDADSAVGTAGQQQQRLRQQQQKRQQQQQQRQKGQASAHHQPDPTKWQALESLCAMMADLGACSHRASLSGGP